MIAPTKPNHSIVTVARDTIHAQVVDQIGHLYQTDTLSDLQKTLLSDVQLHIESLMAWWRYEVDAFQMTAKRGSQDLEVPPIPFRIRVAPDEEDTTVPK